MRFPDASKVHTAGKLHEPIQSQNVPFIRGTKDRTKMLVLINMQSLRDVSLGITGFLTFWCYWR